MAKSHSEEVRSVGKSKIKLPKDSIKSDALRELLDSELDAVSGGQTKPRNGTR